MISLPQLIACGIAPTQARIFVEPLASAFLLFNISTPQRMAAFIAQAGHESLNFTHLEENLFYSTPERIRAVFPLTVPTMADAETLIRNPKALANRVYANKNGNRDEASGDGWKYRGRGLFQLTGATNYRAAAWAANNPYVENPDLAALPQDAALTAAWFWSSGGCNALADKGDIDGCTRAINGKAMLGKEDRRTRYAAALHALT